MSGTVKDPAGAVVPGAHFFRRRTGKRTQILFCGRYRTRERIPKVVRTRFRTDGCDTEADMQVNS